MPRFGWLYRGPQAWRFWLGVVTLVPALFPALGLLSQHVHDDLIGAFGAAFAILSFCLISEAGYLICIPMLLAAGLLLASRQIPATPRITLAVANLAASAFFFWILQIMAKSTPNNLC